MQTAEQGDEILEEEEDSEQDPMDIVECMSCGSGADEANLLLCDGGRYCIPPPPPSRTLPPSLGGLPC